ncbi:hypothetical protein SLS60_003804 [Paraconiothyrium brasiliense]|uniref:Uncharacterized protein n=1 Tax=Paraconiothyrium brasiliense TaxID=300254 RepID=A0ABR3RPP3_9PLEO
MKTLLLTVATIANALGVQAIVASSRRSSPSGENITEAIRPFLEGPGLALCNDVVYANSSEVLYYESPSYTFQIHRQQYTDTIENCKAAFDSIMNECVVEEQVLGVTAIVNKIGYEIYHTELRERDIMGDPEMDEWLQSLEGRGLEEDDDADDEDDEDQDEDEEPEGHGINEDDYEDEDEIRDDDEDEDEALK